MTPVHKALWFVESHSREPIALEDIAKACHVSPFHLTRAFAASTGLSLMRYVRARRLSDAARQLAGGAEDILRLALDAGYGSHEAFTRAFRDQFGHTPEQVRAQGHTLNLLLTEPIAMTTTPPIDLAPPRFEMLKPLPLVGLVERHLCQSPVGIPDQWQRFNQHAGRIPGQVGKTAYGTCYNFDREGNFDYQCGVEVAGDAALPQGFARLLVPANKYVVFAHSGHVAAIRATFSAIWSDWFPQSGHEAIEAPTLERYGQEFNSLTGLGGFEIWIAIKA
ncbi:MAG: AraC family transcriptional regulator [Pirellulales bacterium]